MNNVDTKLDELDFKFFEELPFLVDVFASSLNKLKEIISIHFKELETEIEEFVKINTNWKHKILTGLFTPFHSDINDKPKAIQALSPKFTFDKSINLKKTVDKKILKDFAVAFGFWYNKDHEIKTAFLYLGIYSYDVETPMLPVSFYEKLEVNKFTKVIKYPSKNEKEESIEIDILEINNEEIEAGFQVFKNQILKPFLEALNEKS